MTPQLDARCASAYTASVAAWRVAWDDDRAQYIVTRGEVEVVPTKARDEDVARMRADALAVALNRLERAPSGAGLAERKVHNANEDAT